MKATEIVNRRTKDEGRRTTAVVPRPSAAVVLRNTLAIVCFCVTAWTVAQAALDGPGSGLVGWWKFDEGSGTIAYDSSGSGNNGTLVNGPTWYVTEYKMGSGALSFDGVDDKVVIPSILAGKSTFTVSMWLKYTGDPAAGSSFIGSTLGGFYFARIGPGCDNMGFSLRGSTTQLSWFPTPDNDGLGCNVWSLQTFTMTNDGTFSRYTNGQCVGSTKLNGWDNFRVTDDNIIGQYAGGIGGNFFKGIIDDVRIYNRALSAQEVSDLYAQGLPTNQAPLVSTGGALTIILPAAASLFGTATDDGLPTGSTLSTTWSMVSGPGTVTFGNPSALATTAIFSSVGTYVLRLTASDSLLTATSDITINVTTQATDSSPHGSSYIPPPRTYNENSGISYSLAPGPFSIENLGNPLQANTQEKQIMFRTANNDLHLLLYYDVNGGSQDLQILDTDLAQNTMRFTNGSPGRPGPNATLYYPQNDKIYLGTYYLEEYDPNTGIARQIAKLKNSSAQIMETGDDGWIYIGEYAYTGGAVSRYNPSTQVFQDLGSMDSTAGPQYAYTIGSDGHYIYVGLGEDPWYLAVYNLQTKNISYYFQGTGDNTQLVLHGKAGGLYYERVLSTGGARWYMLQDGQPTEILQSQVPPCYSIWDDRGNIVSTVSLFPSRFGVEVNLDDAYPDSGNGNQATIRWRNVGTTDWHSLTMNNFLLWPITTKRAYPWDDTHLFSFADFYGPVFLYDTSSGQTTTLGRPQYSLYDALFPPDKGRIYLSGYTAVTLSYDPQKAWTLAGSTLDQFDTGVNPFKIRMQLGKYHYYSAFGSDGLVYVASEHVRDSSGGELGWYDPTSGMYGSLREPFMNTDARDIKSLLNGTKIVYADDSGTLFVFDTATKQIERTLAPIAGQNMFVNIIEAEPGMVLGVTATQMFKADIQTGSVIFVKDLGGTSFPDVQSYDRRLIKGPDGFAWLFIDNNLSRINPDDGTIQKILTAPASNLMFQGADIYFYDTRGYGTTNLTRIRNILIAHVLGDVSGDGTVTAYDAALALQQGKTVFEAAQIGQKAVNLL